MSETKLLKIALGILVFLLVYLQAQLWIGEGSLAEVNRLKTEIEDIKKVNEGLQTRNKILEADIYKLKNGLEMVEDKARRDLGLIKEGETFYMFVEPPENKEKEK